MKTKLITLLHTTIILLILSGCNNNENEQDPVHLISPSMNENELALNAILEWENPNNNALGYVYDIYLGTSAENLVLIDTNITAFSMATNPVYECQALEMETEYYWKIRAKIDNQFVDSEVAKFKTTNHLPTFNYNGSTYMIYPKIFSKKTDTVYAYDHITFSGAFSRTDGYSNTMLLINDCKNYPKEGLSMAVDYCARLVAYGYNDWYIPSIEELDALIQNYNTVNLPKRSYWSSTECSDNSWFAFYINTSVSATEFQKINKFNQLKCFFIRKE